MENANSAIKSSRMSANGLEAARKRIGDDVVVYLRDIDDDDGQRASAVLVKRLIRRTASHVELEQFGPAAKFRIETVKIVRIDRVIPWRELLS